MFHCSGIQNIKWYKWDGSYEFFNVIEIIPKCNICDAFQNVSICSWNRTKFACNTNLMLLMPGPYSQYVFKYLIKEHRKKIAKLIIRYLPKSRKFYHDQKKCDPLDMKHIEEYFLLHLLIKITMLLEHQWLISLFGTNQGLYFCMKLYGVH